MGRQATPFGRYTGARHAGRDKYTTHIGNDRFAWFATRPSKSRLNFLDLLRAGHPDDVINATALAYRVEHGVPESIVAALLAAGPRSLADEAAWHLDSFDLGTGHRRRVTEAAMIGSIVARGRLTDTVIVSDDAGQFDVFQHALCRVGGDVTTPAPHRPERADFPHSVLQERASLTAA